MIENPAERVFQIDRECYLIYLGSSRTDYRPFLRIGSSTNLPEEVKAYISTVLVTDTFTGNPFLEHESIELPLNGETRYVGDPERIERLKQFLHEKNLPLAEYVYETTELPPQKGKSVVFFYTTGNLHVYHNGDELFNLRQREEEDLHYIFLADRVCSLVKQNPLRYLSKAFQSPGFLLLKNNLYLFNDSRVGTFQIREDFLWSLAEAGVDPDLLQWVIEEKFDVGILQKVKRSITAKKELRVSSDNLELLRSTVNLFSGLGASLFAIEPDQSGCHYVNGFQAYKRLGKLWVDFPSSIGISIPVDEILGNKTTQILGTLGQKGFPTLQGLVEGVPYRFFAQKLPSPIDMLSMYGIDLAKNCMELATSEGREAWKSLIFNLEKIQQQWNKTAPVVSSFNFLESLFLNESFVKDLGKGSSYLLWNIEELCRILDPRHVNLNTHTHSLFERFHKKGKQPGLYSLPARKEMELPLLGDLWVEENAIFSLFRIEGVSASKVSQANKAMEGLQKFQASIAEEKKYIEERERLLQFIETLNQLPPKRTKRSSQPVPPIESQALKAADAPEPIEPSLKVELEDAFEPPKDRSYTEVGEKEGKVKKGTLSLKIALILVFLVGGGYLLITYLGRFQAPAAPAVVPVPPTVAAPVGIEKAPEQEPPTIQAETQPEVQKVEPRIILDQERAAQEQRNYAQVPPEQRPPVVTTYTVEIPPIGAITISVLDVLYLVNKIAEKNGYRRLDSIQELKPDPNWIFPGNQFKMPDSSVYTVQPGNSLWLISTQYIEREIAQDIEKLRAFLGVSLTTPVQEGRQQELQKLIAAIQGRSHCRAFVEYLENLKNKVLPR